MEDIAVKIAPPILAAVVGALIGYLQGRWSKYREIVYAEKIQIYSKLVEQLLEFVYLCAPKQNRTVGEHRNAIGAFSNLQNSFFRASLFMSEELHEDIRRIFKPANRRIEEMLSVLVKLSNITNGAKLDTEFDVTNFPEFKEKMLGHLTDLQELPGPLDPFVKSVPNIVNMLRRDLGIHKIDFRFYRRKA